jgi:hypothetical protein
MFSYAGKAQKKDGRSSSAVNADSQNTDPAPSTFADSSPGAHVHVELHEMVRTSAQVRQLQAVNEMVQDSPRVQRAVPYQTMADQSALRQRSTVLPWLPATSHSAPAITGPEVVQRVSDKGDGEEKTNDVDSSEDSKRLGLVSWNVQHFSDHDVEGSAKELVQQLQAFNSTAFSELFEDFSVFREKLNAALKKEYSPETFKGLQNVKYVPGYLKERLNAYQGFIDKFSSGEFIKQIDALKGVDWLAEIRQANDSQAKRIILRRLVDSIQSLTESIDSASSGFKIMRAVLDKVTFIGRMDKDLASSAEKIRSNLTKVSAGVVNKSALETFRKALHSHNIVVHVREMFEKNKDWLDVIILQEINDPALLERDESNYTVHRGPHMKSAGKNGQNEYYPLLMRNDSGGSVVASYVVSTDGELQAVSSDQLYRWNKKNAIYRPIMVYHIRKETPSGTQDYLIGVVHTTPEPDGGLAEFNRQIIYDEVKEGLGVLKRRAEELGLPLIIGGDYYLSAEAVVKEPTAEDLSIFDDPPNEDWMDEGKQDVGDQEEDFSDQEEGEGKALRKTRQDIEGLIRELMRLKPKPKSKSEPQDNSQHGLIDERLKFLRAAKADAQIIRNICDLTVKANVEQLGLYLGQAISGTNPKADPLSRWFDLQVADFFVHNETIKDFRVGIMRPEGGMVSLDREDLYYSRYWQHFSDHFPVGGIYSAGEQNIPDHLGRRGQYSEKAVELARVSNLRRFARLRLIDLGEEPNIEGFSEEKIKKLALQELRVRIEMIDPHVRIPGDVEACIALIKRLEKRYSMEISEEEHLFATEPGDFEPDYQASGTEESSIVLSAGKQRPASENAAPRREERFSLDHRQALQSGWNCGDLALQVNRAEIVQWLLEGASDPLIRGLLAPEIRTAAATSFMNQELLSEKRKNVEQTALKKLFKLLDGAKEDEVRSELAAQIHELLNQKEEVASSNTGLPANMIKEEVGDLLRNYYDAHEAIAQVVSQVNDELGFQGEERMDGSQLSRLLDEKSQPANAVLNQDTLGAFTEKMQVFNQCDKALTDYTEREDVFRDYVKNYYGNEGWMVYHLEFGENDERQASTSIIDLAAQFRRTQVRIWVYQNDDFQLNRETAQYGDGVINILYNGYNHFIGLTENPRFSEEQQ